MKYKEIFSPNFIDQLNDNLAGESEDAKIDADEEMPDTFVDIESILKRLEFNIEFKDLKDASGFLTENRHIIINKNDNSNRQRFTMAHELGHAFQGQVNVYRKTEDIVYTLNNKRDEVFANKFAAQFLMPKVLVTLYVNEYIENKSLDKDKLTLMNVSKIKEYLSDKLKVSIQSVNFRIENLNLFVETGD